MDVTRLNCRVLLRTSNYCLLFALPCPPPPPPPPHTRRAVPGVQYTNNGADEDNHSLLTETESEIDLEEDVQSIASSLEDRLT